MVWPHGLDAILELYSKLGVDCHGGIRDSLARGLDGDGSGARRSRGATEASLDSARTCFRREWLLRVLTPAPLLYPGPGLLAAVSPPLL